MTKTTSGATTTTPPTIASPSPRTSPIDTTKTTATTKNTTHEQPGWTRLNYKGPLFHDNRRLLKHRAKNCECFKCYREIYKLPPAETHQEYVATVKAKVEERDIKRAKKKAKKDVKSGKQSTIKTFFQPTYFWEASDLTIPSAQQLPYSSEVLGWLLYGHDVVILWLPGRNFYSRASSLHLFFFLVAFSPAVASLQHVQSLAWLKKESMPRFSMGCSFFIFLYL